MTPERYQQVGELYRAVLELESDQRAAYLAEACAGDELLRQEVESLLGYQARSLVDEMTKRYPEDTVINSIWLPVIRAAIDLQRGNAAQTIEQLQAASRYEAAAEFWPQYLRGQACLKLGRGAEAATEFQKILDHRGYAPLSPLYPLAALGLARAAALAGDVARSRKAREDFLAAWNDADPDLPILIEAKRGYEKR